jgi:hypothetical protein
MDKQRKSAAELAGMVAKMIGVGGLEVVVNPDPVEGWRPTVVKAPRTVERFQTFGRENGREVARRVQSAGLAYGARWTSMAGEHAYALCFV